MDANFVEWNEKCAKDISKIFLLNRNVLKLSFGNIKSDWKCFGHPYKSQNFKLNLQQKTFSKKDAEIRLNVP